MEASRERILAKQTRELRGQGLSVFWWDSWLEYTSQTTWIVRLYYRKDQKAISLVFLIIGFIMGLSDLTKG